MENINLIWYKNEFNPEMSFSNSLWVTIHSQILAYVNIDNYIIRVNTINKIINFKNNFGFIYNDLNLNKLSNYLNYSLKKMKIMDFKIKIKDDNDILKAINYIKQNRFIIIGMPYYYIKKYVKYNLINVPENLINYFVAFNIGDDVILVPDINIDEEKIDIKLFCNKNDKYIIKINYEDLINVYKNINENYKKILYVNIVNKNDMEIKSLSEF